MKANKGLQTDSLEKKYQIEYETKSFIIITKHEL